MKKFAGLVASTLALAGCIPAPLGTYYKPSYDSADVRYSGNMCHGGAGAPATMEVHLRDGVTLAVSAVDAKGGASGAEGTVTLNLALNLPERARVQFTGERIDIVADGRDQTVPAPPLQVSASRRVVAGALFDPKREGPTPELFATDPQRVADFRSSAFLTYSLPDFRPSRIQAELPGLRIVEASRVREVPPLVLDASAVQLARTGGAGPTIYRTEQASAAVAKQYEQCTRNPQRTPAQCRQILDFQEGGFDVEQGGVHSTGRWYVFDARAPFRGELTIEQRAPAAWQFTSREITVRDAASAATVQARIDGVIVNLRYTAPFAAMFVGANNDPARPPTNLSLTMPLPPATSGGPAQRYVIRLPDVSIDGKLLPLRPIELERHRFDVGVLPFNC